MIIWSHSYTCLAIAKVFISFTSEKISWRDLKEDREVALWKGLLKVRAQVKVDNHILKKICNEWIKEAEIIG